MRVFTLLMVMIAACSTTQMPTVDRADSAKMEVFDSSIASEGEDTFSDVTAQDFVEPPVDDEPESYRLRLVQSVPVKVQLPPGAKFALAAGTSFAVDGTSAFFLVEYHSYIAGQPHLQLHAISVDLAASPTWIDVTVGAEPSSAEHLGCDYQIFRPKAVHFRSRNDTVIIAEGGNGNFVGSDCRIVLNGDLQVASREELTWPDGTEFDPIWVANFPASAAAYVVGGPAYLGPGLWHREFGFAFPGWGLVAGSLIQVDDAGAAKFLKLSSAPNSAKPLCGLPLWDSSDEKPFLTRWLGVGAGWPTTNWAASTPLRRRFGTTTLLKSNGVAQIRQMQVSADLDAGTYSCVEEEFGFPTLVKSDGIDASGGGGQYLAGGTDLARAIGGFTGPDGRRNSLELHTYSAVVRSAADGRVIASAPAGLPTDRIYVAVGCVPGENGSYCLVTENVNQTPAVGPIPPTFRILHYVLDSQENP